MMKTKVFVVSALILLCGSIYSQNENVESIDIKFGGYVNWTAIYDSRQTVSLREGHFLLFPSNQLLDSFGNDINAKANFNILSIQTRLNGKIEGPTTLGAKTSGMIEAEFFGTSEGDVNGLRLRHAYINFNWGSTALLIGQTWHPMFITEAFPQVISFNTGVPFQPFARNPQIRFTQSIGSVNLIAAFLTQRDFTSNGPQGYSSAYMRNSALPESHFQVQYKTNDLIVGTGVDFKILVPRLETEKKIMTDEELKSLSGLFYVKYSLGIFNVIAESVYGENLTDLLMPGGYAVSEKDSTTGIEKYTNLRAYSLWCDLTYGKDLQAGIFLGFSKNLGSSDKIVDKIYARAENISELLRLSPRVQFTAGKLRFAAELEYTQALYGKPDSYGKINSSTNVDNIRLLIGTFFFF
ncbi:MAG: hypothetical protein AB1521_02875 [Bacteroidota bacterium]